MNLYNIRGGSRKELEKREYNIGVGISLGNRWFTMDNVLGLTEWALRYTKDDVVIYVADTIHAINIEVRNKRPYKKALEISRRKGSAILQGIKEKLENSLSSGQLDKIKYANWDDLTGDEYKVKVDYLHDLFLTDKKFKEKIISIVRGWTSKEKRIFSNRDLERLAHYIIEEMPEVLNRVNINGISYDAYAYPFDSELTIFIEQIQNGVVFPEIRDNIIDTKNKVFLEVRN